MQFVTIVTVKALASYFQDTLKPKIQAGADSLHQVTDSALTQIVSANDSNAVQEKIYFTPAKQVIVTDTVSVCPKSPVTGITFYDSLNIARNLDSRISDRFPFIFTSAVRRFSEENHAILVEKLKPGEDLAVNPYHSDWIIILVFASSLILGVLRMTGLNYLRSMLRFLSFQGTGEPGSRETSDLFQLPSTLMNLASFLGISLFIYLTAIRFGKALPHLPEFAAWAAAFGLVIAAITLRHIACLLTGSISSEQDTFTEYLRGIYEAYRIAGLYCLIVSVLIVYTTFIPEKLLFRAGFYGAGILYLVRIGRLFLIFIKRHISLFYYILYLCALEILPVVVLVKYVTGLV